MDFRGTGRRRRKGQLRGNRDLDQGYYSGTKEKFGCRLENNKQGSTGLDDTWYCDQEQPLSVWPEDWVYGGID